MLNAYFVRSVMNFVPKLVWFGLVQQGSSELQLTSFTRLHNYFLTLILNEAENLSFCCLQCELHESGFSISLSNNEKTCQRHGSLGQL